MFLQSSKSQRGIALVITLTMLVLLSALIIAFLSSASIERTSSRAYQNLFDARQAGESAVNLIIGQIREATKQEGAAADSVTWASQPGAIQVFGSNAGSSKVFKLYSAEKMQQSLAEYKPELEMPVGFLGDPKVIPTGWVDINEPIVRLASNSTPDDKRFEATFPIVDPYPKYPYVQPSAGSPTSANGESNGYFNTTGYTPTSTSVKGFYCKDIADPVRKDKRGNPMRLLPMPVRWVYLLRDGTYATMGTDNKINGATAENPIVSRVAFWTDDETAKLNINTASEGTFWDTPQVSTMMESGNIFDTTGQSITPMLQSANLSVSQPNKGEFQRYPGHPATTSLGPAIRWLWPNFNPTLTTYNPDGDIEYKESVYRLAPRIANGRGTSRAGSRAILNNSGETIYIDSQHLYATLDEYFLRPDRSPRNLAPRAGSSLIEGEVALPIFSPSAVERLRFFMTPHSRSPELTLFGTPRVTIWPIHADPTKRTTFDEAFAFTSTIKGRGFYFARKYPDTITGANSDYSGTEAHAQRNREVYQYLQSVTSRKVPWLSSSYESALTTRNRDQLLVSMLDYIRCANMVDTSALATGTRVYTGFTPFFWPQDGAGNSMLEGAMPKQNSGQVMPLRIGDNQGYGRFVTPSEIGLLFYPVPSRLNGTPFPTGVRGMRAVLLVEMFTPSPGYAGMRENYGLQLLMDTDFRLVLANAPANQPPVEFRFPRTSFTRVSVDAYSSAVGRMFMPFRGIHNLLIYDPGWNTGTGATDPTRPWNNLQSKTFPITYPVGDNSTNPLTVYPFVSDVLEVPTTSATFGFTGGSFRLRTYPPSVGPEAYSAPGTTSDLAVQTINVNFQSVPNPVLRFPYTTHVSNFQQRLVNGLNGQRTNLTANDANSGYQLLKSGDIIRSMELGGPEIKGDQRLAAGMRVVPASYWSPRGPAVYPTGQDRVHGFRMSRGGYLYPGSASPGSANASAQDVADGKLVPNQGYRSERGPKVPNGVNGVLNTLGSPGDWDRGMSKNVDGAFINKPDEGTMNFDFSRTNGLKLPYWLGYSGYEELRPIHFSPNRLMPSPVMFGSLPRRLHGSPTAWETLLFRPAPATGVGGHPGAGGINAIPDHYWLDFFHMPVVEPYAISEPFSTAGKVNMNYLAAPFSYWRSGNRATDSYLIRRTGMHGIFRPTKVMLTQNGLTEAGHTEDPLNQQQQSRYRINEETTLDAMHTRLLNGLFRSASEICEVELQPMNGPTLSPSVWQQYQLVGDNARERPYAHIYPRLTTKSNVYTVHIRAQSLQKNKQTAPDVWDEDKDQVAGEYRGSTTLERFLDPNDSALTGYNEASFGPLDSYYRFRIIQTRQY